MRTIKSGFAAAALFCLSACATTNYEVFEGRTDAIVHGQGGTKSVVDGMEIWDSGELPKDFKILGFIDDSRPGGIIPMARMKGQIVAKARAAGADAVIEIHSESQIAGYYTSGVATANAAGHSATAYGSSVSMPLRHHNARFAVIKYLQ